MNLSRYNKLIVALVGAAVELVILFAPDWQETVQGVLVAVTPILTALGVYAVPNDGGA